MAKLTTAAQTEGVAILEVTVNRVEAHLQSADVALLSNASNAQAMFNANYKEAAKWHSRAAGILHFIDGITSDGPIFSEREYGRVSVLRDRSAKHMQKLNAVFGHLSQP